MSEWQPTTEFPPLHDDDGVMVSGPLLVFVADYGRICFGECRKRSSGAYFRAAGYFGDYNITHWMPLPEPPKQ